MTSRKDDFLVQFGMAVALVIYLVFIWMQDRSYLMRIDDAFYYFQIGRNYLNSGRLTFDGVNLTNGVQPLWFLTILAVTKLSTWFGVSDPTTQVRIFAVTNALIHIASAWFLYALARIVGGKRIAIVVAWIWLFSPGLVTKMLAGMESPLYAMLLGATSYYYVKEFRANGVSTKHKQLILLGLLVGFTFLARTDAYLLMPIVWITLLWKTWPKGWTERIRVSGLIVAPCAVVIVPYLLINQVYFGHLLPVSGAAKLLETEMLIRELGGMNYLLFALQMAVAATLYLVGHLFGTFAMPRSFMSGGVRLLFPTFYAALTNPSSGGWMLLLALISSLLIAASVLVYGARRLQSSSEIVRRESKSFRRNWLLFLFTLLHFGAYVILFPSFLVTSGTWWWLVPEYMVLTFLGASTLRLLWQFAKCWLKSNTAAVWAGRAVGLLAVIILPLWLSDAQRPVYPNVEASEANYLAAQWIDKNLPPDSVVGSWNAGVLGYFSHRRITNLDGLVNSYEFLRYLERNQLACFVQLQGIQYLADNNKIQPMTSSMWRGIPITEIVYQVNIGTIKYYIVKVDTSETRARECDQPTDAK